MGCKVPRRKFVLACRSNGFAASDQRDAAMACLRSYREHMREYSEAPVLETWYSSVDLSNELAAIHTKAVRARLNKRVQKERERSVSEHDFPTLAEHDGRRYAIKEAPPLIFHHPLINLESNRANVQQVLARYRNSLADDLKILFDRHRLMDLSLKVVGVGSAGTLCDIALMLAAKKRSFAFWLAANHRKGRNSSFIFSRFFWGKRSRRALDLALKRFISTTE
jgi:hypothetical protein